MKKAGHATGFCFGSKRDQKLWRTPTASERFTPMLF
jgi:hypothetical protein